MAINIRASYDSFRDLRENDAYYVDKTEMLEEYLIRRFDKAVLFARPRRFGKTLTLTMFRDFLDIRQDSRDIFSGLKIMVHQDVVDGYMNKYPVVFLSLKEVFGASWDSIMDNFRVSIANLCIPFEDLLQSDRISEADKINFRRLQLQEANDANTAAALGMLARMLHSHYGRPAFIIIDEYDVPMARAYGDPYYDQVRELVERMLSYVCKSNDNVKAVMISGCLYTVKNSTYTGVNNINLYSVLSPVYAASIGFTDGDVRQLLEDAGMPEIYNMVSEWYDGYMFGREKIFCPWDVLSFVRSRLDGSYSDAVGPKSYWINTSETSLNLIRGFLGRTSAANERFEQLMAGNTIDCMINEYIPYHRIHENGENLWSALLETGYLTKTLPEETPLMPLRIPNKEIQMVFREEVWNYFRDRIDNVFVTDLINALWAAQNDVAEAALCQILEATLSFYHEYHEYSYHLILDGFFTGFGYRVQSELETGYGRSDLIIQDAARRRCIILELKHVKKENEMTSALQEAASQIVTQKYASRLVYEGHDTILRYGMAFCNKAAIIQEIQPE